MGSFNYGKIRTMGAVLVAISIPIFTSQLEKSREAVDLANIRSAYAEVMTSAMTGDTTTGVTESSGTYSKDVILTQKKQVGLEITPTPK